MKKLSVAFLAVVLFLPSMSCGWGSPDYKQGQAERDQHLISE